MKKMKINATITMLMLVTVLFVAGCSKKMSDSNAENEKGNLESASNKGKKYKLVTSESKLEWLAKKVTGEHDGTVDISAGELFADKDKLNGGNFDIDFTTISALNMDDEGLKAKLIGHLKSEDFFSASAHPIGKFEITSTNLSDDGKGNNYNITGKLTIKGITKEISFPAKVNISDDKVTASADFNIDRTLWDIKFRSGKFYENLGDNLIYDDFNIKFNITAK